MATARHIFIAFFVCDYILPLAVIGFISASIFRHITVHGISSAGQNAARSAMYLTNVLRQFLGCITTYTGWAKKKWGHVLMTIILSNRFKNFTGRFSGKFVVKWTFKIPPHLAYVAALPCETLMLAKQAINNKLQSSVATHFKVLLITKLRKVYLPSL